MGCKSFLKVWVHTETRPCSQPPVMLLHNTTCNAEGTSMRKARSASVIQSVGGALWLGLSSPGLEMEFPASPYRSGHPMPPLLPGQCKISLKSGLDMLEVPGPRWTMLSCFLKDAQANKLILGFQKRKKTEGDCSVQHIPLCHSWKWTGKKFFPL